MKMLDFIERSKEKESSDTELKKDRELEKQLYKIIRKSSNILVSCIKCYTRQKLPFASPCYIDEVNLERCEKLSKRDKCAGKKMWKVNVNIRIDIKRNWLQKRKDVEVAAKKDQLEAFLWSRVGIQISFFRKNIKNFFKKSTLGIVLKYTLKEFKIEDKAKRSSMNFLPWIMWQLKAIFQVSKREVQTKQVNVENILAVPDGEDRLPKKRRICLSTETEAKKVKTTSGNKNSSKEEEKKSREKMKAIDLKIIKVKCEIPAEISLNEDHPEVDKSTKTEDGDVLPNEDLDDKLRENAEQDPSSSSNENKEEEKETKAAPPTEASFDQAILPTTLQKIKIESEKSVDKDTSPSVLNTVFKNNTVLFTLPTRISTSVINQSIMTPKSMPKKAKIKLPTTIKKKAEKSWFIL